ncbi:MAG: PKD domain-containing protein [Pedobacter sp.]|nr:MAG: PKD domain-containing protein [Pedobacter sp.]
MKIFNQNIRTSIWISLGVVFTVLTSCKKDEIKGELGVAPNASEIQFTATPTAANPNIVNFKSSYNGINAHWDFGNGTSANGNDAQSSYPQAGTYTVKLTILSAGGNSVSTTKTVTIANTNPAMLSDPEYALLSGGIGSATGKTWIIDKTQPGHLGVGPVTAQFPDWYQAGPNEKATNGFYDDEMTFQMTATGLKYTYVNNGTTFANASNAPGIGGPTGSDDPTVNYTPPTNLTWSLSGTGTKFINIGQGGFIAYYLGVSQYQIMSINENEMWLRSLDKANSANAWYLKLIRKGFERPVVPPVQKPLQAANLTDDFQVASTFTWSAENMDYVRSYDNPLKFPINTSAKVATYEKRTGDEGQYGNMNVTLPYRFDLTAKNKIRLKVFIPSANDFTKVRPTVAIKLQNSLLGGNAWQTQIEIVKTILPSQFNTWVQLEFDYSGSSAQTLYDKIVVQLGGEGHPHPGLFFIDDFEFK